jgi:hypothetical protein
LFLFFLGEGIAFCFYCMLCNGGENHYLHYLKNDSTEDDCFFSPRLDSPPAAKP